ncbi:unnamed protein product, partial [Rotaria magnacalcarata]
INGCKRPFFFNEERGEAAEFLYMEV